MRFNRLCLISAIISAALSLLCTRSDVITGAGGGVLDPSLTANPGRGFARAAIDSLYPSGNGGAVDSAFSLPRQGRDPRFSTHFSGDAFIGVTGEEEGDTLTAHAQFIVTGGAFANPDNVNFDTAAIYFPVTDNSGEQSSREAALFSCDPLPKFAPVNRGDTLFRVGNLSPANNGSALSVKLDSVTAARVFDARKSPDASASDTVAFSIVNYHGNVLKLGKPYIVIAVHSSDNPDSIWSNNITTNDVRSTAFEKADAEDRAKKPYSSQYSLRTAVFKINVKTLFDKLPAQMTPVDAMNALVAVSAPADAYYKAVILDTLLTHENSTEAANTRLLRDEFAKVRDTLSAPPYKTHNFMPAMRSIVDKYNLKPYDQYYIYVYLRPVEAEGGVIVWDKPLGPKNIQTVFKPTR